MAECLQGIKVIDLSRVLAGPWAGQLLADLGAEVIKVEKPNEGDDTRHWSPPAIEDGTAAYYLCANRGKQSVTVDLSTKEGQTIVKQLILDADVLIENYKVGGLQKYGLDYESLKSINPRLIYCSITGFGQTGPFKHRPGYDFMIQGLSGVMSLTGPIHGEPSKAGIAISDLFTGLYAVIGIQAALLAREHTGLGQQVDLSLLDCMLAVQSNNNMNWLVGKSAPIRVGNAHPNIVPYQAFKAGDGAYFILATGNDRQFQATLDVLGLSGLGQHPDFIDNAQRVKHREKLVDILAQAFLGEDAAVWLAALEQAGVPCGPIHTIDQAFEHPQVKSREMAFTMQASDGEKIPQVACPVRLSETPVQYHLPPPKLGEHTLTVLRQLGYTEEQVIALKQAEVI